MQERPPNTFKEGPEAIPTPEETPESISFELNGTTIEMYGVFHGRGMFEQYREHLEKAIHNASAVIVEAAPTAEGVYSPEIIEAIRDWIKRQDIVASDEEITQFVLSLQKNEHLKFYADVEKIVAQEGRPLITIDPRLAQNTIQGKFEEREQDVALAKKIGAIGGSGLFLSLALYDFVSRQQEKSSETDKKSGPQKMSRREFLKTTTKVVVGLSSLLALGSLIAEQHEPKGKIQIKRGRTENPAGPLLYNLMDFRNVAVAQGLHMASKENFGDGPIVLIYGSAHLDAIQHYSQRDTEREIKYQSYLPYREVDPPVFRVYSWSEENNWLKEEESNIK